MALARSQEPQKMPAFAAEIINLTFLVHGGLLLSSQSEATHRSAHDTRLREAELRHRAGTGSPRAFHVPYSFYLQIGDKLRAWARGETALYCGATGCCHEVSLAFCRSHPLRSQLGCQRVCAARGWRRDWWQRRRRRHGWWSPRQWNRDLGREHSFDRLSKFQSSKYYSLESDVLSVRKSCYR
jgi:hypothetical protein